MTVIDSLVITLGLDPTKFTEGQKAAVAGLRKLEEQSEVSSKNVEAHSKKLLDFFVNVKRQAIELVSAFYGGRGVADMVQHITALDASAARLGNITRTLPRDIALWRVALEEVGGSAGEADSVIRTLSATLESFKLHPDQMDPQMLALFGMIGATPGDTPTTILQKLAAFSQTPQMKEHPEQFAARAMLLPGMTENMINLLMELPARIRDAVTVVPKDGGLGAFSKDFIRVEALFEAAVTNFSRSVLDNFVPTITGLTKTFTSWLTPGGGVDWSKMNADLGAKAEEGKGEVGKWLWDNVFGPPLNAWATIDKNGVVHQAPGASAPSGGGGSTKVPSSGNTFAPGEKILGVEVMPSARGAATAASVNNSRTSRTSTTTSEVNIGGITVNTQATDAPGIAGGIKGALGNSLGAPVNSAY